MPGPLPRYDPDAILADPDSHPKHVACALINIGIRDRGERWAKCLDCGEPYQLTDEWTSPEFCSDACCGAFTADLLGGL
jgi:hypothetical protein